MFMCPHLHVQCRRKVHGRLLNPDFKGRGTAGAIVCLQAALRNTITPPVEASFSHKHINKHILACPR